MKSTDIIKNILESKGMNLSGLAYSLRIRPNTLSERFKQKSITTKKLGEMFRVLGYKIVVVPCGYRVPDGGYELTDDEAEEK